MVEKQVLNCFTLVFMLLNMFCIRAVQVSDRKDDSGWSEDGCLAAPQERKQRYRVCDRLLGLDK